MLSESWRKTEDSGSNANDGSLLSHHEHNSIKPVKMEKKRSPKLPFKADSFPHRYNCLNLFYGIMKYFPFIEYSIIDKHPVFENNFAGKYLYFEMYYLFYYYFFLLQYYHLWLFPKIFNRNWKFKKILIYFIIYFLLFNFFHQFLTKKLYERNKRKCSTMFHFAIL